MYRLSPSAWGSLLWAARGVACMYGPWCLSVRSRRADVPPPYVRGRRLPGLTRQFSTRVRPLWAPGRVVTLWHHVPVLAGYPPDLYPPVPPEWSRSRLGWNRPTLSWCRRYVTFGALVVRATAAGSVAAGVGGCAGRVLVRCRFASVGGSRAVDLSHRRLRRVQSHGGSGRVYHNLGSAASLLLRSVTPVSLMCSGPVISVGPCPSGHRHAEARNQAPTELL